MADGYLKELPRTSRSMTLSRLLTPLQCLMGATSCFSSSANGDDAEADMLSFHRTEPQRAPHAKAEAERSSGARGRERKRKWRETDGLARGRFGEFSDKAPMRACCFMRQRMSG